jgi:hypothetical protein
LEKLEVFGGNPHLGLATLMLDQSVPVAHQRYADAFAQVRLSLELFSALGTADDSRTACLAAFRAGEARYAYFVLDVRAGTALQRIAIPLVGSWAEPLIVATGGDRFLLELCAPDHGATRLDEVHVPNKINTALGTACRPGISFESVALNVVWAMNHLREDALEKAAVRDELTSVSVTLLMPLEMQASLCKAQALHAVAKAWQWA